MSLGKDLASIRKSKNLSLEDIQNAIKIPLDTIKSIEDGSIFNDPGTNKTYLRSFVRSYAKELKLDDEKVVQALDEVEAGRYTGSLAAGAGIDTHEDDTFSGSSFSTEEDISDDPAAFQQKEPKPSPKTPKESSKPVKKSSEPELSSINWADMGRKFTSARKSSKIWLGISFFIILGVLIASIFIFWDDLDSLFEENPSETQGQTMPENTGQETIIPTPVDSAEVQDAEPNPETEIQDQTPAGPISLGDTLTLTVYAAYDQLEPVRVTSDFNWRTNPFWMEEGEAFNFDFRDTLLVRGQYSRMLLLFNGHIIENPRQNYFDPAFNSIMITRSVIDQPEYLAPAPEEFPLEIGAPDSTVYRIRY
ncbi:MAG: helix-turn-helix transcriptional regulator [Gracilimonas sp.]